IAERGKKVCLFDADFGLANIDIMLGISARRTLMDVINSEADLSEIILRGPGGIDIVPGASGIEEMANIGLSRLSWIIGGMQKLEKEYDYIIFDTAAGISRTVSTFVRNCHMNVVVMTPDPASLADAYAVLKLHGSRKAPIGVLVNQAGSSGDGEASFERLNMINRKFLRKKLEYLGALKNEKAVPCSVRSQKAVLKAYPKSSFSAGIRTLARRIAGTGAVENTEGGFFKKLSNSFLK
ncbi:MAG: MinD/ParA family protein, partial [Fibrobacterota bacterium]